MAYKDPERLRAYNAARYAANREKICAQVRARRERDPEAHKAAKRAAYAGNIVEERIKLRTRYWNDPAKARMQKMSSYFGNHEKNLAQKRTKRIENLAKARADAKRWRLKRFATNPDIERGKERDAYNRRRASKKGAPVNDLTHAQWLEIQAAQDHRCYYCHKRCKGKLTQDHIIPLSKGGSHTLHNVIGACHSCNSRKGTRPPPIPVQPLLLTVAPARKKAS